MQGTGFREYVGATGDGLYRVSTNGQVTSVQCDMTRDGGGWMLMYAQVGASHVPFAAQNAEPVRLDSEGSHLRMQNLMEVSSEFRWTYPLGMRNNMNHSSIRDITGYNDNTSHMSWFDNSAAIKDRSFSWSGHIMISHCTQFKYP